MNQVLPIAGTAPDHRARFTTREFLHMCATGAFDGLADRIELIDGELQRMPPPGYMHGRASLRIGAKLEQLLASASDRVVVGETGIMLDEDTVVGCDAAIVRPIGEPRMLRPDEVLLAVEVAHSSLPRDLGAKKQAYARAGIPDYWVVDLQDRLLLRFSEPTGGEYDALPPLRFGEPMPVPGTDGAIVLD